MKKRNFRHATQTGVKLLFSIMALLLFLTGCNVPTPTPSEDPTTPPNTQETELPTEQPTEKPIEKPTEEVTAAPEVEDPILKRDMEIKQAYIRYLKIDDECLLEQLGIDYYGDFNGVHVAFIKDGMFQDKMWSEVIGGVEIPYSNSRFLWAYYQGNLYTLSQAYELRLLNQEHIEQILEVHLEKIPSLKNYLEYWN